MPRISEKPADVAQCKTRLVEVSADDEEQLQIVAELHMEMLDFGPMAGLGLRFIRDVGYKLHMRDDLLRVALCYAGDEPAGFVSYTSQSMSFHRQSLSQHLLNVCWVLLLSLLENPLRVANLFRALKVVRSRRDETRRGSDPMGEVVSIAVRREFLRGRYLDGEGRRVSPSLVAHAQAELRDQGVEQMRMLVDADNKGALFLYHGLGARMESYEQAGEPMVEVWFDLADREIDE